jgi:protein-S-isoprenylcysteine O-methyltransferase Ste14
MPALEHRIPPPLVFLLVAAAMGAIAWLTPATPIDTGLRFAAAALLALSALAVAALAITAFGRANTTVNPVDIAAASTLVTGGVFGYTRNPMYFALTALLLAWAIWLAAPVALLGPAAFAAFITRFQIIPEERVLREKFGGAYADYMKRVRRWL